jgi:hypothetical protein
VAVLRDDLLEPVDEEIQPVLGAHVAADRLLQDLLDEFRIHTVEDRREQTLLAAEVPVERALLDARRAHDARHAGGRVAALREQLDRGVDDAIAADAALHTAQVRCARLGPPVRALRARRRRGLHGARLRRSGLLPDRHRLDT